MKASIKAIALTSVLALFGGLSFTSCSSQDDRAGYRDNRQDGRQDTRDDRQDNRGDRQDGRQENRDDRQDNR